MRGLPGFTAEVACNSKLTTHYRSVASRHSEMMTAVTPQLWRTTPIWKRDNNEEWYPTTTETWYDDPGGWGVPPSIGDVAERRIAIAERQCQARCKRITDPQRREECLENCA